MFAYYGIRGNILKWFDSYITNISQFIMYDNIQAESRTQYQMWGIPITFYYLHE